ncbi:hypothetical protein [Chamaesiphon sp. OTE_75_metabat_556]|uniref:hypothetical protein n=1 Tax=Chamaesiphon sp. OTE_75_metabat_556 TaxID=2964692 RepID=UPI00286D233A|nr:hypothetical protein [Chamaesiphon sp. OTE_75_metabat_556]
MCKNTQPHPSIVNDGTGQVEPSMGMGCAVRPYIVTSRGLNYLWDRQRKAAIELLNLSVNG